MIRVLIVEDSPVVREFLVHVLTADPSIEIAGVATNGEEALEAVARLRPDVITMDVHMPRLDGLEATRRIMETTPTPVVIVSGTANPREVSETFAAIEAGALAVLSRPAGIGHPDHDANARELVQTVKLMAEVRVVRRWPKVARDAPARAPELTVETVVKREVVVLGASTGGPPVLQTILSALPAPFPLPVLIVQHMAAGFTEGFAGWLAQSSGMPVHVAVHGEKVAGGHAYVAPDARQMKVDPSGRIVLTDDPMENGVRPSVSYLFRAVAGIYGASAVAGLLTGMGRDGAEELKLLRDKGALTFAQDQKTCVVHGMPGEAVKLDAARYVLTPDQVASLLTSISNTGR